jgi:DNA-3-methyladenine glycosylase II
MIAPGVDSTRQGEQQFARQVRRGLRHLKGASPELGAWIDTHGRCALQVQWEQSLYESLVRAVAHQQLHGRAAATILARFEAGFRGQGFPTPAQVMRAPTDKLRGMGFSTAKTVAIQGIARAAQRGEIPPRAEAESLADDEIIARLTSLKGVGRWTVEMLLIFTLGRLDTMPVDDFGVQSGLMHLLDLPTMPKKADFALHTDAWKPYRSIAAWYLWRKAEAVRLKS